MDTRNPYFTRAEVAYRQEQARREFRRGRRRKADENAATRPIGMPLVDPDL